MERVAIIGAGEVGKAIAHCVERTVEVEMWDNDPEQVPSGIKPLEDVLKSATSVFICVPSWVVREVAVQIAPLVGRDTVIVSLAKGIEQGSLKTIDVVLKDAFPDGQMISILGGPLLAEELVLDLPGIGVLASDNPIVFDRVRPLFDGSSVRLEYVTDMRSVALASVLKNSYAIGLGIAEGLGWGWNGKGWLASRAIQEMAHAVRVLGGDAELIAGPAGTGDFIATAMSPHSHNRTAGLEIARTGIASTPSEGSRSLPLLLALLGKNIAELPLLSALDRVVTKHEAAKDIFQALL